MRLGSFPVLWLRVLTQGHCSVASDWRQAPPWGPDHLIMGSLSGLINRLSIMAGQMIKSEAANPFACPVVSVPFPHSSWCPAGSGALWTQAGKGATELYLELEEGRGAESMGQVGTGPEQGWAIPAPGFVSPHSLRFR